MSMDDKVGSIIDANVRQIAAQKQEIARIEATGAQNNRHAVVSVGTVLPRPDTEAGGLPHPSG